MNASTIIQKTNVSSTNDIYVKREDLLPFSFGGNKARKAQLFFEDVKKKQSDCVVTYGSNCSNHCRIVANYASHLGLGCYVISPISTEQDTFNSQMVKLFDAKVIYCTVDKVKETIDGTLEKLKKEGRNPYFIQGGGHGNIGTQAYVNCWNEIHEYSQKNNICFDYVFLASGTGTTQAGMICGQILSGTDEKIIGISIARRKPYGRDVVIQSIRDYLGKNFDAKKVESSTNFVDEYIGDGYGSKSIEVDDTIKRVLQTSGIPLDQTYTGKAFYGMEQYLKSNGIIGKKVLFIHTGGTPLFFEYLNGLTCDK